MDQISRLQEYTTDVAHRIALTLEEIRTTAPPMTVAQARNVHVEPEPPERKKFREENTARLKALMSLFLEGTLHRTVFVAFCSLITLLLGARGHRQIEVQLLY